MPEAITSNVKVHLKTRQDIEGFVAWANPITRWDCITVDLPVSRVVAGTTTYVGGLASSGNSLWFDRSVQQIPTSAEVINIADLRYCPLSNVVGGNTQYANLYVDGATATIIDANGNTGDGNIPTHDYTVVQVIEEPYSARAIPSEYAVAAALGTKQHLLSAGSFIYITSGVASDTIGVSATQTVAPTGQALQTQLPTEAAVRGAINDAVYYASNYAYSLVNDLDLEIQGSGYATANWVNSNFVHSGEIVPVDVPYGSYGRAGKVQFVQGSGLTVDDDEGTIKLSVAGTASLGGVMIPAAGGLAVDTTTGAVSLGAAGIAATSRATTPALGGVRVVSDGGLNIITNGASAGNLSLAPATSAALGGVVIPANRGLSINNSGSLTLARAPNVSTAEQGSQTAVANSYGGVIIATRLIKDQLSPGTIVPSVRAVSSAYGENIQFVMYSSTHWTNISSGRIFMSGGGVYNDSAVLISNFAGTTLDVGHDNTDRYAYVKIQKSNGTWTAIRGTAAELPDDSTDTYYVPIVSAHWGQDTTTGSQYVSGYQLHEGPIIVGKDTRTGNGGGGQTTITQGSGISVTGAPATGYTVGMSAATTASIGGVIVGDGLSVDTAGKISVTGGGVAGYEGPFVVASEGGVAAATTVSVAGGYLKWLDGNVWVEGVDKNITPAVSRWVLNSATYNATSSRWEPVTSTRLYLVGSSGAVDGLLISSPSYVATISGATVAQQNVSHTTVTAGGRYKWVKGTTAFWTPYEMPIENTPFYATSDAVDSCAEVTAFTYSFVADGVTYSKTNDMDLDNMAWADGSGGAQYTSDALPSAGEYTMFTLASRYGYATVEPSLPPAGAFYTMLAQNQGGTIKQQQYGTVWHEHWGNDYKGQFAVSRIAKASYAPTYVPNTGDYAYRMAIVTGGVVYGCDGFDVLPEQLPAGAAYTPGGVYLNPGAILYEDQIISGTTKTDGIYLPYGQTANIWLNIWYGVWPQRVLNGWENHQSPMWQFVATTFRMEGTIGNTYSIYLGWVTPNGSPQQDHRGAITIRGRWD